MELNEFGKKEEKKLKTFSDMMVKYSDHVSMDNLVGKEIMVISYEDTGMKAKNGDAYYAIDIKVDGETKQTKTASRVIVEQLQMIPREEYPWMATIAERGSGLKTYYTFV